MGIFSSPMESTKYTLASLVANQELEWYEDAIQVWLHERTRYWKVWPRTKLILSRCENDHSMKDWDTQKSLLMTTILVVCCTHCQKFGHRC
jgi:hypothetical protein